MIVHHKEPLIGVTPLFFVLYLHVVLRNQFLQMLISSPDTYCLNNMSTYFIFIYIFREAFIKVAI